jgi:hypothetical protein
MNRRKIDDWIWTCACGENYETPQDISTLGTMGKNRREREDEE